MPRRKPLADKPGARPGSFRPDNILEFPVAEGAPGRLLDFLFAAMPDSRKTTVKDYLKYNQVMVDGNVTTRFDQELEPGQTVKVNTPASSRHSIIRGSKSYTRTMT